MKASWMSMNSGPSFSWLEVAALKNLACWSDPLQRWIFRVMPLVRRAVQGVLVIGDVLAKIVTCNQPPDEVFKHFAVSSMAPHVLVVVIVPDCIMLCKSCFLPWGMFLEVMILVSLTKGARNVVRTGKIGAWSLLSTSVHLFLSRGKPNCPLFGDCNGSKGVPHSILLFLIWT